MKKWKKELAGALCFLLALGIFCHVASAMFVPGQWPMYEKEPENTVDVMVFGSSLAYCNVNPAVIYEETGITSYVLAGSEQTMPVTYRYLKQALKTQHPKVVLIECTGLLFSAHNRFTKVNIVSMPLSVDKLELTFQEAEPQERLGILFPLEMYHSTWGQVTGEDIQHALLGYQADPLAGYTFLEEVSLVGVLRERDVGNYPETYARNVEIVGDILALCEKEGVRPIFFVAATATRPNEENMARIQEAVTSQGGELWDCNQDIVPLSIDFSTDFYDEFHFNYRGAQKFSSYLGQRLVEELGLAPTQGEDEALWQQRMDYFHALRDEADSQPIQLSGAAQ